MADTKPDEPEDWRERAYWEALARAELSSSQDYDRAILTLSSATLALSATFLKDIAPVPVGCSIALLAASWVALVVAIVAIILSFLTSQVTLRDKMMRGIDRMGPESRATSVTIWLNRLGGAGFIIGIVLFVTFAFVNL